MEKSEAARIAQTSHRFSNSLTINLLYVIKKCGTLFVGEKNSKFEIPFKCFSLLLVT